MQRAVAISSKAGPIDYYAGGSAGPQRRDVSPMVAGVIKYMMYIIYLFCRIIRGLQNIVDEFSKCGLVVHKFGKFRWIVQDFFKSLAIFARIPQKSIR